jgi:hypothetical protein
MLLFHGAAAEVVPALAEITLSDEQAELVVLLARRELMRARMQGDPAALIERIRELVLDLGEEPIVVVRRLD